MSELYKATATYIYTYWIILEKNETRTSYNIDIFL